MTGTDVLSVTGDPCRMSVGSRGRVPVRTETIIWGPGLSRGFQGSSEPSGSTSHPKDLPYVLPKVERER